VAVDASTVEIIGRDGDVGGEEEVFSTGGGRLAFRTGLCGHEALAGALKSSKHVIVIIKIIQTVTRELFKSKTISSTLNSISHKCTKFVILVLL
jgi:hypothetical protein